MGAKKLVSYAYIVIVFKTEQLNANLIGYLAS